MVGLTFWVASLMLIHMFSSVLGSRLGLWESTPGSGSTVRKSSQSRLLCFVVTAIAKLATYHRELLPRTRVCLAKVRIVTFHYIILFHLVHFGT